MAIIEVGLPTSNNRSIKNSNDHNSNNSNNSSYANSRSTNINGSNYSECLQLRRNMHLLINKKGSKSISVRKRHEISS